MAEELKGNSQMLLDGCFKLFQAVSGCSKDDNDLILGGVQDVERKLSSKEKVKKLSFAIAPAI